jgi:hypothetical protein
MIQTRLVPLVGWALLLMGSVPGRAHFVWIEADQKGASVEVRSGFGEFGVWQAEYADQLRRTTYELQSEGLAPIGLPLRWESTREMLLAEPTSPGVGAIRGVCVWGLFGRGAGGESLLTFYPKGMFGPPSDWEKVTPSTQAKLEIVPSLVAGGVSLLVLADGAPLPNASLKLFPPGATTSTPAKTDAEGRFVWSLGGAGRYGVAVVHRIAQGGMYEGKPYVGLMHSATLTFDHQPASARTE